MPGPNPTGGSGGARYRASVAVGPVVKVLPTAFERLVSGQPAPLVVRYAGGWWRTRYHYLTAYKGLLFYARSDAELRLPGDAEVIDAQ